MSTRPNPAGARPAPSFTARRPRPRLSDAAHALLGVAVAATLWAWLLGGVMAPLGHACAVASSVGGPRRAPPPRGVAHAVTLGVAPAGPP